MRPVVWEPPEALSAAEQAVVGRIKRAKLFPFLRRQRRALFSVTFQEELATLYQESERGQPPVPPAKLALVTIVQAYTRASDDEAIEALTMDRRWQLVLDCLDAEQAPFGNVFASLVWVHRRFCCAMRRHQTGCSTRSRSRSKFARPYISRLVSLSRFTWPSTWPWLHSNVRLAATAA
jgi:hypothetical protein